MPDIERDKRSNPVRVVGGGIDNETNLVNVTDIKEISTSDILNNTWTTGTILVGTTAIELKVGASAKQNRKSVFFQLLDSGRIYWGFSNSNTPFIAFKHQTTVIATGDETSIWIKANDSGKSVGVGEA